MKNLGSLSITKIIFSMALFSICTLALINDPGPPVEEVPPCESELQAMNDAEAALNAARKAATEAYANWQAAWRAKNEAWNHLQEMESEREYRRYFMIGTTFVPGLGGEGAAAIFGKTIAKGTPIGFITGAFIGFGFNIYDYNRWRVNSYIPAIEAHQQACDDYYEANQAKLQTKHDLEAAQALFDAAKATYESCMSS
jgi:hypothetical protein